MVVGGAPGRDDHHARSGAASAVRLPPCLAVADRKVVSLVILPSPLRCNPVPPILPLPPESALYSTIRFRSKSHCAGVRLQPCTAASTAPTFARILTMGSAIVWRVLGYPLYDQTIEPLRVASFAVRRSGSRSLASFYKQSAEQLFMRTIPASSSNVAVTFRAAKALRLTHPSPKELSPTCFLFQQQYRVVAHNGLGHSCAQPPLVELTSWRPPSKSNVPYFSVALYIANLYFHISSQSGSLHGVKRTVFLGDLHLMVL